MLPRSLLTLTVLLIFTVQILSTGDCWTQKQRHKREWIIPAKRFTENVDYSHLSYVSKIRSDSDKNVTLRYTLKGPGANQPPIGYFIVNPYTGFVRLTRPLDREERQNYTVSTSVTQVVAKDADEPNTLHTRIAYTLIKQEPNNGMLFFAVDKGNGTISVKNPTLDREVHRSFVLTVQAADMYGSPEGNSAMATVFIDITDFSASIDENEAPVEVLRIQALDNDEERTDNWLAEFEIVSGNEDGRFSIETDPKTNMGVLYLNKPVDFESTSNMNLNLVVSNKALPGAPLGSGAGAGAAGAGGGAGASGAGDGVVFFGGSSSVSKQKTYSVKISVRNKPEGPKFKPKVKPISVSEKNFNSFPRKKTGKTAEKVKYTKGYDPDNWISIDMETAEIKLNKVPDRDSPFVVEDLNDNCPRLLNNVQTVCSDTRVVNVTAEDEDSDPNGAPLEFSLIPEKTKGKWNLQRINDISASLFAEDDIWSGFYEVTMEIRDKQGLACPEKQVLRLEVCTCSEGAFCASKVAALRTTSASFGKAGIVLLVPGFLCLIWKRSRWGCSSDGHPIKSYKEGGDEIKTSKEPISKVKATSNIPVGKIQVSGSNQAVYNSNSSKMTRMVQKSAFGGFYYDMDMENQQRPTHYDYEGEGSVTSSISSSFTESNDDLEFLDTLESKFSTLAKVCGFEQTQSVSQTDPKVTVNCKQ
ncbi:Desmoglein-2 [Labeo rohita]|uniref:Desmoglein-2 n=1 Tax=Labeo rohita TaxID=84645 RepID=A0ABQ8LJF2_LABRO|nr:Desmoglein-2 [Labeo rohita]